MGKDTMEGKNELGMRVNSRDKEQLDFNGEIWIKEPNNNPGWERTQSTGKTKTKEQKEKQGRKKWMVKKLLVNRDEKSNVEGR